MKKNVGMTYVKDFSFPPEQGFTGSAGKSSVKGYMRGGHVKDHVKAAAQKKRAPGPGAAHGGHMKDDDYSHGGTVGVTTKRGPKSRRTKSTMTKAAGGGYMEGGMHDKLYAEGEKMGYMRGGRVKDTSAEFVQQSRAQDPMDNALVPAGSTDAQDKAAGGHKRLKPKFKKGGGVRAVRMKEGGRTPSPPSVGHLGEGALARGARAMREHEMKIDETAQEAIAASRASMRSGTATHDRPPKPAAKKAAPGSQRGKRPHYGLPFKSTPMVK
jgi:hypothetical protein